MPIRGAALKKSNTSTFEVLVDKVEDYEQSGVIYNQASESVWHFEGTLMFVNILESFLDHADFPQHTHTSRSFDKKIVRAPRMSTLEKIAISGALKMEKPTFIIRVQYRQNATWQGTIQWVDQKKTQQFRSVLEMIKLMEEVVETTCEPEEAPGKWAN